MRCGLCSPRNRKINIVCGGKGEEKCVQDARKSNFTAKCLNTLVAHCSLQWGLMRGRLMSFAFEKTPRISLGCKLVPVQYREYEYGSMYLLSAELVFSMPISVLSTKRSLTRLNCSCCALKLVKQSCKEPKREKKANALTDQQTVIYSQSLFTRLFLQCSWRHRGYWSFTF